MDRREFWSQCFSWVGPVSNNLTLQHASSPSIPAFQHPQHVLLLGKVLKTKEAKIKSVSSVRVLHQESKCRKLPRNLSEPDHRPLFRPDRYFWLCSVFSVMGRGQIRGFCWWQGLCSLSTWTLLRMKVDAVNRRSGHGLCASDPWLVWSSREWWIRTFWSHHLSPRKTASSPHRRCSVYVS